MRLLLIPTPDLAYESGSTLFIRSMVRALARRGWEIDVLCQTVPSERIDRVRFHRLPLPLDYQVIVDRPVSSRELFDSFVTYLHALRDFQPDSFDVVHSVYATFTGLAGCAATWFWQVPHVVTTFGRDVHVGAAADPRYRAMIAATLAAAHHVTVPTSAVASDVIERYGVSSSAVTVLPSGVDVDVFGQPQSREEARRALGLPADALVCLAVQSSFSSDKGLDVLLRALPAIAARRGDVLLVVIGRDDLPDRSRQAEYAEIVRECGVEERTRFVGPAPHSAIPTWLAAADLFVDPRRSGNFSTSMLEAIAAGVPAVASDLSANLELLDGERNGAAFRSGDTASLAARVVELADDPAERARISRRQRAWTEKHRATYGFDAVAARLEAVYRSLL